MTTRIEAGSFMTSACRRLLDQHRLSSIRFTFTGERWIATGTSVLAGPDLALGKNDKLSLLLADLAKGPKP